MSLDPSAQAPTYDRQQSERWLAWMAAHLRRQGRTIFLLERIDESWLDSLGRRALYLVIFAAAFTLIVGSVLSAFDWLSVQLDSGVSTSNEDGERSVAVGLGLWWLATFVWALVAGVLTWFRPGWLPSTWSRRGRLSSIVLDLVAYWLVWLAIWKILLLAAQGRVSSEWLDQGGDLARPALIGLLTVVVYGLRYGVGHAEGADVRHRGARHRGARHRDARNRGPVAEALGWSWRHAGVGLMTGLAVGGALWVVFWFGARSSDIDPARNLKIYLPIAAVCGLLGGGLRMRLAEKSRPNEGIRLSTTNALIAAALGAPIVGLTCWGAFAWAFGSDSESMSPRTGGLAFGALGSVILALWFGGGDVLRHWVLRLALIGRAPRRWIDFLEFAARIGLLRRVGGGYIFVHRFLLDHFADRESISTGS